MQVRYTASGATARRRKGLEERNTAAHCSLIKPIQFDELATLTETVIEKLKALAACHHPAGMNSISPARSIPLIGCAASTSGNVSRSGSMGSETLERLGTSAH